MNARSVLTFVWSLGTMVILALTKADAMRLRENRPKERFLGAVEKCSASRGQYFRDYGHHQPSCNSCVNRHPWEYDFTCTEACSLCSVGGTSCFALTYHETWASEYGLVSSYKKQIEYCQTATKGPIKGTKYCMEENLKRGGSRDSCRVYLNGRECAWCEYQTCSDGFSQAVGDCSNIATDSSFNNCDETYSGLFGEAAFLYRDDTLASAGDEAGDKMEQRANNGGSNDGERKLAELNCDVVRGNFQDDFEVPNGRGFPDSSAPARMHKPLLYMAVAFVVVKASL